MMSASVASLDSLLPNLADLYGSGSMTDLLFVCSDGQVPSYRLLMASASPLLRQALADSPDADVVFIRDVSCRTMMDLHYALLDNVDYLTDEQIEVLNVLAVPLIKFAVDVETEDQDSAPSPEKDIFSCKVCHKEYSIKGSFLKHVQTHKNVVQAQRSGRNVVKPKRFIDDQVKCFVCEDSFGCDDDLANHTCDLSQGSFKVLRSTSRRKKSVAKESLSCTECSRCFSSKQSLMNHLLVHRGERPFQCGQCSKSFVSKGHLQNHERLVHHDGQQAKPWPCHACDKHFYNSSNLQRHLRARHFELSDKKSFECSLCLKSFTDPSGLTAHIKTHSSDKPFSCTECQKSFRTQAQLRIHSRIHTGVRPYSCADCPGTFVTRAQLQSHCRHKHLGLQHPKNNLCPKCGDTFVKHHDLKIHMLAHSGELPLTCQFCHKGFRSRRNLNTHIRVHTGEKPYRCNPCGASFCAAGGLQQHYQLHQACRLRAGQGPYSIKSASKALPEVSRDQAEGMLAVAERDGVIVIEDATGLVPHGFSVLVEDMTKSCPTLLLSDCGDASTVLHSE